LPIGAFAALATSPDAATAAARVPWGAASGGLLLALGLTLLARRRDDESERGRHLAMAASAGWLAIPAGAAWWLGFAPGPAAWLGGCVIALGIALWRGSRAIGPAGGPVRLALAAAAWVTVGSIAALAIGAAAAAARGARVVPPSSQLTSTLYDLDAAVLTQPLPSCVPRPREIRTLRDSGAHPSLSPDGRFVWFDAPAADPSGRRQIHRLVRASGEVECWTCGEPGHNIRPHAADSGLALVFESDREVSWLHPDDTEIFLLGTQQQAPSRRLTFHLGPDDNPRFGPGSRLVVWSRRKGGHYQVVSAALRSGHGGIRLGQVGPLASGGSEWIGPLGWAPNARRLVLARGNPFAPLTGLVVDPASGAVERLDDDVTTSAAFGADGEWLAVATARGRHWAGALPGTLGFALGPWAHRLSRDRPLLQGTGVRAGPTAEIPTSTALDLPPDFAAWGTPTGISLAPDGRWLVLGQRRESGTRVDERLVEITLTCAETAFARSEERTR
jgi:hypothetical protein